MFNDIFDNKEVIDNKEVRKAKVFAYLQGLLNYPEDTTVEELSTNFYQISCYLQTGRLNKS